MTIPIIGSTVNDESARIILEPTVARLVEAVGPMLACKHLSMALAGVASGAGFAVATQIIHATHMHLEEALAVRSATAQQQNPQ